MTSRRRKSSPHTHPELDPASRDRFEKLREALRETYTDIENEPVPERIQALIDALRKAEENDPGTG